MQGLGVFCVFGCGRRAQKWPNSVDWILMEQVEIAAVIG